jgi:dynein heavy chain
VVDQKSAQITLLISMLFWVVNVEESFDKIKSNKKAMQECGALCQKQLEDLIKLVQGKLEKPTRTKIMCMITLDTHGRDIANLLHNEECFTPDGFQWQAQLKP